MTAKRAGVAPARTASGRKARGAPDVTNRLPVHPYQGAEPSEADEALVAEAAGGDRAAMERLLLKAQDVAYRFSVTVCGNADDAEDAMQEALMSTYRHARQLRHPGAFRPWLYRTVRNACLMGRRRRVNEPRHPISIEQGRVVGDNVQPIDVPDPGHGPEAIVVNRRLRRRLQEAMARLPAAYRAVVFLRDVEGLPTREVAHALALSEANVKQRLHRARALLQRDLGGA